MCRHVCLGSSVAETYGPVLNTNDDRDYFKSVFTCTIVRYLLMAGLPVQDMKKSAEKKSAKRKSGGASGGGEESDDSVCENETHFYNR